MHVWRKIVATARTQDWEKVLSEQGGIAPERLVIVEPPAGAPDGGRAEIAAVRLRHRARLEIYCETAREAARLVRKFGGRAHALRETDWQRWLASAATDRPLVIGRGRLVVTNDPEAVEELRAQSAPAAALLCIPAAMAFGTGGHATTAMCLRLLDAVAQERSRANADTPWRCLDLGAGSGILALAAVKFGARQALGLDNDAAAVRIARENARKNGVSARRVQFQCADMLAWRPEPAHSWPVIVANIFSEILVRLLPEVIAPALAPDGDVILSGVLRSQTEEVIAAAEGAGFELVETKSRGRWRAFRLRENSTDELPA